MRGRVAPPHLNRPDLHCVPPTASSRERGWPPMPRESQTGPRSGTRSADTGRPDLEWRVRPPESEPPVVGCHLPAPAAPAPFPPLCWRGRTTPSTHCPCRPLHCRTDPEPLSRSSCFVRESLPPTVAPAPPYLLRPPYWTRRAPGSGCPHQQVGRWGGSGALLEVCRVWRPRIEWHGGGRSWGGERSR